ncbi:MAG: HD-GYP domain-containing protein [Planctomycetota bacterium]
MTSRTGQLVVDPERKHLTALADHLRRHDGVTVRVYDADGRLALAPAEDGSGGPDGDEEAHSEFFRRSCESCRDADSAQCLTGPDGRRVQVLPIRRSSIYFGSLVACGPDDGEDLSRRSTGAVLDAMLDVLAEESAKEHEIDSLAGELALRYEEIELLYEIDEKIPLRSYTSNVMEFVVGKAFSVLECSCLAWVGTGKQVTGLGEGCRLFWAPDRPEPPSTMLRLEAEQLARNLAERCRRNRKPETISGLDSHPELRAFAPELNSVLTLPLTVESEYYGSLIAFKPRGEQFTSYELKLMTALARKSAFVIRDSRLYEDLDALFFNLIKLLVNTIENKDQYTKGHSQRVKTFTVRLAELMGLPRTEIEVLNLSGLLHDIGKQGIPDAVLKKEGKLTDDEMAMIKTHPIRGVNLIKHIKQFEACLPHIRHHHERIDGAGYPDGLKGEEIPTGARIIAVADTYDALTSDRCYRPRFSTEKAFQIIEEVAGTQLDEEVARLLLENREEFARYTQAAHVPEPGPMPAVR